LFLNKLHIWYISSL